MRAAQAYEDDVKRRLLIIAIFLLAGAVVNVAVAWGCAAFIDPTADPNEIVASRTTGHRTWELLRFQVPGVTFFWSTHGWMAEPLDFPPHGPSPESLLPSWSDLAAPTTPDFLAAVDSTVDDLILERRYVYCSGWPLRNLWCDSYQVETRESIISQGGGGYIETSFAPWRGFISRRLPLRLVWSRFAVNTLVYAGLLWLLIPGPFALRRFLRVRRGLCPKCAYPMGESAVCTECGRALAKHAVA